LSKIQQLSDIESHLETLRRQRDELQSSVAQLEETEASGGKADYSILVERLQELKVDPATQEVERLCAEKKDFKRRIRRLTLQIQGLQARVKGHEDVPVLTERRDFLAHLVEVSRMRRARAQVNMRILQKKMRQETFQLEMRSFL
jgi:chromosome segregation ATPase